MDLRKNIQNNLILLLKHRNFSQKDLADACGIKAGAVSKWINGSQIPNVDLYDTICNFLGVSLDQLFGRAPIDL